MSLQYLANCFQKRAETHSLPHMKYPLCWTHCNHNFFFFFLLRPNVVYGLLFLQVSRSQTTTHHSRWGSSGRMISPSQRPFPDTTQNSQHTEIHAPGRIRTHNLNRRAAADPCLRTRGHWDRLDTTVRSSCLDETLRIWQSVATQRLFSPCFFLRCKVNARV
jgi:hypothetical protein